MYVIQLTENEMEFFKQLFKSDIPVTLNTVEIAANLKTKILNAAPLPKLNPLQSTTDSLPGTDP